ncbi:MAG: tetratricopeptide repeat protein [Moorea sp. SIO1G6]|uniref:tetratricopeptide repeat protein n=1 Tax=Moorena sp. SIO1G6 TaxID=2607840 RepID=UPI0013C0F876|nr:tetratricopeptide repeat protein [Moorena sp. SIO1G6]NET67314.1 tetratricopeptide repeat protein [Moorena sp. SIO1G6]
METAPDPLTPADHNELDSLVTTLALSSGTTIIFAIAPESGPNHPVVQQFTSVVNQEAFSEEEFQVRNFFYSQDSLINFLYRLNPVDQETSVNTPAPSRPLIMAFGIDQLEIPRRIKELKRLNVGRESLFERDMVLMFWLNKPQFLDEFRLRAPDFWDWREQIVEFQTHPPLAQLFYPYLDWLIAQNSYLKFSGVMQVQRQVDIFLDQVYISLKAERQKLVVDSSDARHLSKANLSSPSIRFDEFEAIPQDIDISSSTKTIPEKVDLAKAIQDSQYSVILGDPGAGKTTLLKYLALHFATAQRDDQKTVLAGEANENLGQTRLPVFFRIADYAERLATQSDLSLQQFLREFSQQWQSEFTNQTDNELSNSPLNPPILGDFDSISPQNWGVRGAGDFDSISPQNWGVRACFQSFPQDDDPPQPPLIRGEPYSKSPFFKGDLGGSPSLKTHSRGAKPSQLCRSDNTTTIFEHLCHKLHSGMCLVLLDGLDEVFNQEIRQQIVNQIEEFVTKFRDNKFVITSRIAGYREVKLSQRFSHFTITEMEPEQVERFLDRWCLAVEKAQRPDASKHYWQQEADHQSRELKEAIAASEGVKRMTGNPLLLTILALIHRNGSRLPNQRVKLYELAVQTLTEDWQLSKKLPGVETVVLKESQVMGLLAPLAYWMHEQKPSGLVSEPEVREKLAQIHGKFNDEDPDSQSVQWQINDFLRRVRETTGLFVERAPGSYGFMHLTFEEYFAARYIADNDVSEILDIINSHRYEARWDEPILLALGYLGSENPRRINKLVPKLFKPLDEYQPRIDDGEIKIRKTSSKDVVLVWPVLGEDSTVSYRESPSVLQDLLFAGQVLADVDVNSKIRARVIQQLVSTYLGLDEDFEHETIKELLTRLREIERFNQKDEVIKYFKEAANNLNLNEERWVKTKLASLYVACGQAGETLVSGVNEFVQQLVNQAEPKLFNNLIDLVTDLGEEMTSALEATRQHPIRDHGSQQAIEFVTALSYLRPDNYNQAIGILEEINQNPDSPIKGYIAWAIATCYRKKEEYDKAIAFYQESLDINQQLGNQKNVADLWSWLGISYRTSDNYQQALDCQLKDLAIRQQLDDTPERALAYYQLARIYQAWGKYDEAIRYHEQSRELYHQLDLQKDVADSWYWLADCYRDWGKYQQAVDCQLKDLAIRQQLDHQSDVALAYYQLGRIYQDWGQYDQAIAWYQQSRELCQQLDKQKDVANQWYRLGDCYRDWGKYQQAVDCELKDLAIRQQLDDQPRIALAYYQLGRIYQDWGQYDQGIRYHQQSLDLYQQLDNQKNVANLWYWLGDCYRDWGKYQQAVDCELKDLAIRQQLDDQPRIALAYYQLGRIYQDWGQYQNAIAYYQQSRELYHHLDKQKDVADSWYWLGDCYRDWGRYQQAVDCELKDLAICQQLDDQPRIALAYWKLGYMYQTWGQYENAIRYHEKSRDLYQHLDLQKDVANSWLFLAVCYRNWGKYQQAIDCQLKDLAIRQQDDQPNIALAYNQLGRIYQDWGQYQNAIAYHQQSRDLYHQLDKQKDVANQLYWLADCYRNWGKYQQAVDCQLKTLAIRQQLDDQPRIALAYWSLGRIYQNWGKYDQAIRYHQQSRDLYQQLDLQKDVADSWYWLAFCYRNWGKYQQAVDCQLKDLEMRQQLDDQKNLADAYYQLGRIYQDWGQYDQAIRYHQQSRDLYQQLDLQTDVANQWYWLADCYRELDDYTTAIDYYQQSLNLHQQLGQNEKIANRYRKIGNSQRLLARNTPDTTQALHLLSQGEQSIGQAIEISKANDYKANLAYNYTALGLLYSERLRRLPSNHATLPEQIEQFETNYTMGLRLLSELGEIVDRAEEILDMSRAYLEVNVLENLDRAEALAMESLQVFLDYNRRKLQASARQLLGEIYLRRVEGNQPNAKARASQFFSESLEFYRTLDIQGKVIELEQQLKGI